jgi:hypothetical protein
LLLPWLSGQKESIIGISGSESADQEEKTSPTKRPIAAVIAANCCPKLLPDSEVVQVAVGPAHRRLDVIVEFVERAILHHIHRYWIIFN